MLLPENQTVVDSELNTQCLLIAQKFFLSLLNYVKKTDVKLV